MTGTLQTKTPKTTRSQNASEGPPEEANAEEANAEAETEVGAPANDINQPKFDSNNDATLTSEPKSDNNKEREDDEENNVDPTSKSKKDKRKKKGAGGATKKISHKPHKTRRNGSRRPVTMRRTVTTSRSSLLLTMRGQATREQATTPKTLTLVVTMMTMNPLRRARTLITKSP